MSKRKWAATADVGARLNGASRSSDNLSDDDDESSTVIDGITIVEMEASDEVRVPCPCPLLARTHM